MASSQNQPVISYTQTNSSLSDNNLSTITPPINNDHLPWSDEEKLLLCKTVVKYPPGIPNRWEKIAAVLGRNLNQVTEMANKIKTNVNRSNTTTEDIQQQQQHNQLLITDDVTITERDDLTDELRSRKKAGGGGGNEIEWSQTDQRLLECALKTIDKDLPDRWDKISKCIPGKSKEECLVRYRTIVQNLKQKKLEKFL